MKQTRVNVCNIKLTADSACIPAIVVNAESKNQVIVDLNGNVIKEYYTLDHLCHYGSFIFNDFNSKD